MEILKLQPIFKDYIWGGQRLREDFGFQSDLPKLAEGWMLACHQAGMNTIDGGSYDGQPLEQVVESVGKEALCGTNAARFPYFPVLIKLIDAKDNLSIQVHPDNDYARRVENEFGKTEMWYVLDCEPGAFLYYGFDHEISREELEERIRNNTLTEVLNAVPVKKGDCFFIPSGTLHAICKGVVVAEVQQNSNVTYRVYDYGRVGADGKPRALHVKQALEVMRRTPPEQHDFSPHLAKCDYFTVDVVAGGYTGTADETSFVSLLITEGEGRLTCGGETVQAKKGDSFFITAGSGAYALTGSCKALLTTV